MSTPESENKTRRKKKREVRYGEEAIESVEIRYFPILNPNGITTCRFVCRS